jgi:transposase InsO family protein
MFVVYVEGPRDRDLLRGWAQRVDPPMMRALADGAVILGGRQPRRAAAHFRALAENRKDPRGLCVLDRDDAFHESVQSEDPGLEFHVWKRRHIESYLLVPEAIRRSLRLRPDDRRLLRACRDLLPDPDDEAAWLHLDAKRLLAPKGPLSRAVGLPLRAGRIARSMLRDEIHPEVRGLLAKARAVFQTAS